MTDTTSAELYSLSHVPVVTSGDARTGAPAPDEANEELFRRVEEMLDATELAIGIVEEQDGGRELATAVTLSVVMPVYNERETIREIVRRVEDVPVEKEIVIVDDASTDGTRDILRELESRADIRVFYHTANQGKGAALRTALANVTGDVVIVQDADLEYDPSDYPQLLQPILDGQADVVYGSRFKQAGGRCSTRLHRLGNRVLTGVSNFVTGYQLTDMETCYKVFRRDVLSDIEVKSNRFGVEPELTAKLARRNVEIFEVPIRYLGRSYSAGKKIRLRDAFDALYCILRYAVAD